MKILQIKLQNMECPVVLVTMSSSTASLKKTLIGWHLVATVSNANPFCALVVALLLAAVFAWISCACTATSPFATSAKLSFVTSASPCPGAKDATFFIASNAEFR